jgi:hypothetical protein
MSLRRSRHYLLGPTTTIGTIGNIYSQFTSRTAGLDLKASGDTPSKAIDMFSIICGAALVVAAGASFWYFLPRNGQVHPLVRRFDGGSMITLAIMTILTIGVVMMFAGYLG